MKLKKADLSQIKIPCLFGLAEDDKIVNNDAIKDVAAKVDNSILLELEGAKHEILMEQDDIRNNFLNTFDKMLKDNNVKDKLKRF